MSVRHVLPSAISMLSASLLAVGCAVTPYSQQQIDTFQSEVPTRMPVRTFTPTESLLTCLGHRLREAKIPPILIGIGVNDTTGKTGVHQGLLMRSALQKIAAGGSGLQVTNMGVGPTSPNVVTPLTPEQQLRANGAQGVKAPDLIIEGGVTSVHNSGMGEQTNIGAGGRDLDMSHSRTRGVDAVSLSYVIKRFSDGVDVPGAFIDLKVVYQQASVSTELGAYLAFRMDNRSRGFGLRMGSSSHKNENPEDAIRTGIEAAAAILISERYSIDIHDCPMPQTGEANEEQGKNGAPTMNDLAGYFHAMTATDRIRWIQHALIAKQYLSGAADGQNGPLTRDAIRRYERQRGLPPSGGQPTLAVFLELARERVTAGEDVRQAPAPKTGSPAEIKFVTSRRFSPYTTEERFDVDIVVPQAGWLYCYFFPPGGGPTSVFPSISGRPGFVAARAAVPLLGDLQDSRFGAITLDEAGTHALYCAVTRTSLAVQLPEPLRPGNTAPGWSVDRVRAEVRKTAGAQLISDGQVNVRVSPRKVLPTPLPALPLS